MDRYILDEHEPVKEEDLLKWGEWMETGKRIVRKSTLTAMLNGKNIGKVDISTVFLGLDHGFGREGAPVLFETMIFGGEHDQYQDRCSTWEAAEKMHEKAEEMVKTG